MSTTGWSSHCAGSRYSPPGCHRPRQTHKQIILIQTAESNYCSLGLVLACQHNTELKSAKSWLCGGIFKSQSFGSPTHLPLEVKPRLRIPNCYSLAPSVYPVFELNFQFWSCLHLWSAQWWNNSCFGSSPNGCRAVLCLSCLQNSVQFA